MGLDGWFTSFKLRSAGWPQLEAVALLLVLGVLSARAVPGVRWVAALTGVVATAAAFSAATAADWFVDHLGYRTVLATGGRLLFAATVVVVAWAVAAVLLQYSDGLLPGPGIRSVRRGVVRAVPVGGGNWLGVALFGGTLTMVGDFVGGPDRIPDSVFELFVKTLMVKFVVWAVVVTAVSRPAGLRARDAVFLGGAGLVRLPAVPAAFDPPGRLLSPTCGGGERDCARRRSHRGLLGDTPNPAEHAGGAGRLSGLTRRATT